MNRKSLHYSFVSICACLFLLVFPAASAGQDGQLKTVDGLSIYVGVLPAEMLLGHPKGHHEREMHGGVPVGINRYHVVIALFDAASGKRITDAQVKVGGASLGMATTRKKAEPMLINNVVTYGAYITLPGSGSYKLQFEIRRPGARNAVEVEFDYPFAQK